MDLTDTEQLGNKLPDQCLVRILDIINKILHILSGKELVKMRTDNLRQMGSNNGRRVYHRISQRFRPLPLTLRNPQCRQMIGRLECRNAGNLLLHIARIHCHIVIEENLTLTHRNPLNLDQILVRV